MVAIALAPGMSVGGQQLVAWLQTRQVPRQRGREHRIPWSVRLRFAFYGRTSTSRFQDVESSLAWQFDEALRAINGRGDIVVRFFDVGCSRSLPWHLRPQAAALLAAAAAPGREFDVVVIGEFERAFAAGQAPGVIAQLNACGVEVWIVESDGPIDLTLPEHRALLSMLGQQSQREVLRARRRTTAAMCAQVRTQGRHQGGRPPFGYRLVDAGPHPNVQHARWGRRLLRLDIDPDTAPHVRRIFQMRLEGHSVAGIARTLNAQGVLPPSGYDRERNPHREGVAWGLRTVAAILENPRYTGRQVWKRQSVDHHELQPGDKSSRPVGSRPTRSWNPRDEWAISPPGAHPALVSEADFLRVQQVTALPQPDDGNHNRYQLTGLVICGLCGRRLEGHWAHGRARYRCRHGHTSASDARPERFKTLYVREDRLLEQALQQLTHHLEAASQRFGATEVAAWMRHRGYVLVCTPISIVLDTSADGYQDPESAAEGNSGQMVIPGMEIFRKAFNPHQGHSPNVKDLGGG